MNKRFQKVISLFGVITLSFSLISASTFAENIDESQATDFTESSLTVLSEVELQKQLEHSKVVILKHQKYRQANNLDSSDQAIRDALNATTAQETILKYSIALTEEEANYIQHRDDLMVTSLRTCFNSSSCSKCNGKGWYWTYGKSSSATNSTSGKLLKIKKCA
jgi:uncharacterized HAD superfamily protein